MITKLTKIVESTSGISIDVGQGPTKMKSTKLFLDNLNLMNGKTPLSLVSPKGQFTSRGKTAQTGRADNTAGGTLPDIDSRYDRPSSNNRNGFLHKKVNNLFNQGKE